MKPDAEIVMHQGNFYIPRNFNPKLIIDVGLKTRLSSFDLHARFPEAKILSFQYDNTNFLLDSNDLAYHDKIKYHWFDSDNFHLDKLIFNLTDWDATVDFIKFDAYGKEKNIFKEGGLWPDRTRFIKARLGKSYDYPEAKRDLALLGFEAYAMYDNECFYVVGENIEA